MMVTLFKMALRNLGRHKRRTFLTGMMIAVGALTMFLSFTYSYSVTRNMTETAIKACAGNILIHADFEEKIELFMPSDEAPLLRDSDLIRELLMADEAVEEVAPRLRFGGLVAVAEQSPSGVIVTAVDPLIEPRVTPKVKTLEGSYLTKPDGIILGETTAKSLNAHIGQDLILIASNQDGYLNAYPFEVEGIVTHEGMGMFLDYMNYISIDAARSLLYLDEDEAFELAVALKNSADEGKMVSAIERRLEANGFKLRVDSWKNNLGIFYGIIVGIKVIPQVMLIIIILVVVAGISNTILVSILERIREIGTLMALGTKRREVMGIFLLEIAVLSSFAAGIGLVIGSLVVFWIGRVGIRVTIEALEFVSGGEYFYLLFNGMALFISFMGTILITLVAAFFPARTATRLAPVEALRSVK